MVLCKQIVLYVWVSVATIRVCFLKFGGRIISVRILFCSQILVFLAFLFCYALLKILHLHIIFVHSKLLIDVVFVYVLFVCMKLLQKTKCTHTFLTHCTYLQKNASNRAVYRMQQNRLQPCHTSKYIVMHRTC